MGDNVVRYSELVDALSSVLDDENAISWVVDFGVVLDLSVDDMAAEVEVDDVACILFDVVPLSDSMDVDDTSKDDVLDESKEISSIVDVEEEGLIAAVPVVKVDESEVDEIEEEIGEDEAPDSEVESTPR